MIIKFAAALLSTIFFMVGGVLVGSAFAQSLPVQTSPYWCSKLGGTVSGKTCMAAYVPHPGACAIFKAENVDDQQMTALLNEVASARVCLAKRVEEAKINSLKLRTTIMGFVTAGNSSLEDRMDPGRNKSYRPENGKASYWPAVSYYLYQCVVETCTSK